jgi:hypothetical protein
MLNKEELESITFIYAQDVTRDIVRPKLSPENRQIFDTYFTPEKLLDSANWTDSEIEFFVNTVK